MNCVSKLGQWLLEPIGWGFKLIGVLLIGVLVWVGYVWFKLLFPGERAVREFCRYVSVGARVSPDGHTGVFDAARATGLRVQPNPGQEDQVGHTGGASIIVHNGFVFSDKQGQWQCLIEHDGTGRVTAVRVNRARRLTEPVRL